MKALRLMLACALLTIAGIRRGRRTADHFPRPARRTRDVQSRCSDRDDRRPRGSAVVGGRPRARGPARGDVELGEHPLHLRNRVLADTADRGADRAGTAPRNRLAARKQPGRHRHPGTPVQRERADRRALEYGARTAEGAGHQGRHHDRRQRIRQPLHRRATRNRGAHPDQAEGTSAIVTMSQHRRYTSYLCFGGVGRLGRWEGAMDEGTSFAFDRIWRARTDRRAFLLGGLALVGAGALTRVQARPRWSASPFSLGVASGDPAHDGVVLWTRLAPEPLSGGGMPPEPVEVLWEVADRRGDATRRPARHAPRRRPTGRTPSTSRSKASSRIVGTGIASTRATRPARSAARARCRGRATTSIGCGSRSPPARTTRTGSSPPTATWPRRISTWCSTSGDYIYEGPGRDGQVAQAPGARDRDAAGLPQPLRAVQARSGPAGGARGVPVDRHVGRSRGRQQLRQRHLRARRSARRVPAPPRGRLPGVLRAHAAPPAIGAARTGHSALPPVRLRQARLVLRARHPAVPHRPALRRRHQGAVSRRGRSAGNAARRDAGAMAVRRGRAGRRTGGTCCRSR